MRRRLIPARRWIYLEPRVHILLLELTLAGGDAQVGASIDSEAMRLVVFKALSDPQWCSSWQPPSPTPPRLQLQHQLQLMRVRLNDI